MDETLEQDDQTTEGAEGNGEKPETKEKTFTQSELDKIVKNRLKGLQDSHKNLSDSLTAKDAEILEATSKYEGIINDLIESYKENLTANEKVLLSKLSVLDQVEFLKGTIQDAKKNIPPTPKINQSNNNIFKPLKKVNF